MNDPAPFFPSGILALAVFPPSDLPGENIRTGRPSEECLREEAAESWKPWF